MHDALTDRQTLFLGQTDISDCDAKSVGPLMRSSSDPNSSPTASLYSLDDHSKKGSAVVCCISSPCPWLLLESSPRAHLAVGHLCNSKREESLITLPTTQTRYVLRQALCCDIRRNPDKERPYHFYVRHDSLPSFFLSSVLLLY